MRKRNKITDAEQERNILLLLEYPHGNDVAVCTYSHENRCAWVETPRAVYKTTKLI